jgi:hypothetical protein
MLLRTAALQAPYVALLWVTKKYFPRFFTGSFVVIVFLMSFVHSALVQFGSSFWTRLCFVNLFLCLFVTLITNVAAQFFTGRDGISLLKSMFVAESRTQRRTSVGKDKDVDDVEAPRDLSAPGVPASVA